jgi:hypothetical protein
MVDESAGTLLMVAVRQELSRRISRIGFKGYIDIIPSNNL